MGALADTALAHEFPSLDREGLVYLDSGATSQTPRTVLDAMDDYYAHHRGSVHRGVYPLAAEATELFEGARERIARWLNWGVERDDLHRQRHRGAQPRGLRVGRRQRRARRPRGRHRDGAPLELRALAAARAAPRGRVLGRRLRRRGPAATSTRSTPCWPAATSRSSPSCTSPTRSGTINPIEEIVRRAHDAGAIVVVDGAQAVPQLPVDLARAGRRLLRLDRPQGLRADRRRRPARPRRPAGRDAALHHRRAHDRLGLHRGDALGAEPGEVRGRHLEHRRGHRPGRRGRLPAGHRHGARARPRARARRPTRSSACARSPGITLHGPPDAAAARRAHLLRPGGHPPPRRGRDPRPPGDLRARRAPLLRSRSCAASAWAPRRARPSACTTPTRTSTRSSPGSRRSRRSSPDGRPLPRGDPRALQAPPQLGADGGSRPPVLRQQPAVRGRADGHAARRRRRHRRRTCASTATAARSARPRPRWPPTRSRA